MSDTSHDRDVAFIQALAELLRENDLSELRVKREYAEADSLDVRVSRLLPQAAPQQAYAPAPTAQADQSQSDAPSPAPKDPANDPGAVTSPMVGTVYLSPEPDAQPFIKVGDTVEEGQTLLIVEAMKTMNHIPAPRSGTVRQIIVEDGAPVEFGALLLILG